MRDYTTFRRYTIPLITFMLSALYVQAQVKVYTCEAGVQGGLSYYVGDATNHVFQNIQPVVGGQFRYKFTPRWALQFKGEWTRIRFDDRVLQNEQWIDGKTNRKMINFDFVGEFNFFRFGVRQYDERVKPITPYMFLGIGLTLYNDYHSVNAYLPFGFGLKWKCAPRTTLIVSWQHQLYFTDGLEGKSNLNNTYKLNGADFLNNDLTGELSIGVVFEFWKKRERCMCD